MRRIANFWRLPGAGIVGDLVEPERGLTAWYVDWPEQFRLEWAVDEVPSTGHFRPPVAWIRQPEDGQRVRAYRQMFEPEHSILYES